MWLLILIASLFDLNIFNPNCRLCFCIIIIINVLPSPNTPISSHRMSGFTTHVPINIVTIIDDGGIILNPFTNKWQNMDQAITEGNAAALPIMMTAFTSSTKAPQTWAPNPFSDATEGWDGSTATDTTEPDGSLLQWTDVWVTMVTSGPSLLVLGLSSAVAVYIVVGRRRTELLQLLLSFISYCLSQVCVDTHMGWELIFVEGTVSKTQFSHCFFKIYLSYSKCRLSYETLS